MEPYKVFPTQIPYCQKPDFDALEKFVIKHNIRTNIDALRKACAPTVIIFEDDKIKKSGDTINEQTQSV